MSVKKYPQIHSCQQSVGWVLKNGTRLFVPAVLQRLIVTFTEEPFSVLVTRVARKYCNQTLTLQQMSIILSFARALHGPLGPTNITESVARQHGKSTAMRAWVYAEALLVPNLHMCLQVRTTRLANCLKEFRNAGIKTDKNTISVAGGSRIAVFSRPPRGPRIYYDVVCMDEHEMIADIATGANYVCIGAPLATA